MDSGSDLTALLVPQVGQLTDRVAIISFDLNTFP